MAKAKKETVSKIKVTLVKSTIATIPQHKKIIEALGLKKINSFRIHNETPSILGMIAKVGYLIKVEKIEG